MVPIAPIFAGAQHRMLNSNKAITKVSVTFAIIMMVSSLTVLGFGSVTAQSTDSDVKELVQVTNAQLTISHIWGNNVVMPLEKGDHVQGKYRVSHIFYYPNWPTIDLEAEVVVKEPNGTSVYCTYTKSGGSFNFTASQSGNYTLLVGSNLVGELLWRGYILSTSQINQATPLKMTLNYTITGAPLEISVISPVNQTYLNPDISVQFSSSRVFDWAGYCLDGADKISFCDSNASAQISGLSTIAGYANSTLINLPDGTHTLTLYANDSYGNMASQTVAFTIGPSVVASSVPLVFTIVVVAIVIGVLAVAFLYRRQRKQNLALKG
jgi:hypothetical protein